jgi:Putative peptidoglycan binding domain
VANRRDGDPGRPLLAEEDDWFRRPSAGPIESGEVAWQDEPELPPPRPTAALGSHPAIAVLAAVVALLMIIGGILGVRAITSSGGTGVRTSTTTVATNPPQTTPGPTAPGVTTTPNTIPVPTAGVLRSGSAGPGVKGLQQALSRLGYALGAADGSFGAATVQAVIAFQKAHGLPADGIAGTKTLAAINVALGP